MGGDHRVVEEVGLVNQAGARLQHGLTHPRPWEWHSGASGAISEQRQGCQRIISGCECLPSTSHKVASGPAHMPSG